MVLNKAQLRLTDILLLQAEVLWISCRQDLIHLSEAVGDLDLCFVEETSGGTEDVNSRFRSLATENMQKIIGVLHPALKRTLLDCFRKNNILFHVSGEEAGSKIWYAEYIGSLYPRVDAPRRHLGAELLQSITGEPSPAPGVGSGFSSPVPSPDAALSPAPVPSSNPASTPQPSAVSPREPFFPQVVNNSSIQPPANEYSSASPDSSINVQGNKQSGSHKSVVIAVVVTASVTVVVAALFFLCYMKCCRTGSGGRRNDERPLLSLSMSDFSVGIFSHVTFY